MPNHATCAQWKCSGYIPLGRPIDTLRASRINTAYLGRRFSLLLRFFEEIVDLIKVPALLDAGGVFDLGRGERTLAGEKPAVGHGELLDENRDAAADLAVPELLPSSGFV